MKKLLFLALFTLMLSCDDGDLQIETVDFDSITTVQSCGDVSVSSSNFLFKINGDEALIVELPSGLLKNEVSTTDIKRELDTSTKVTYRIFSDNVTLAYFCDELPPLTPSVVEEIEASAGFVLITTVAGEGDTFVHTIRLSEISFVNKDGDTRITDLQINEFGTVTTSL
ncbi:hypothetical protein [Maribacter aestuarii]|uniref:hypothetical protein n=1 Tax=Maribacter aestuarii TaxID=1130723 RepID=UPI00248AC558|nr:hypothetical protein [Maribacter aestuarii]